MHIHTYAYLCLVWMGPCTLVEVGGKLNEHWFSTVWILGRDPRSLCLAEGALLYFLIFLAHLLDFKTQ